MAAHSEEGAKRRIFLQLTLVRHGETAANREHILQGQMDTPLSEQGRRQSELAGRKLASCETISQIYCSDLSRAVQTAELIRQELGYPVELSLDARLRERRYGGMEGQPVARLVQAARKEGLSVKEYTASGGESMEDVSSRVAAFLLHLLRDVGEMELTQPLACKEGGFLAPPSPSPHWHVLLVSHGGALHTLCEQLRQFHGCILPHRNTATPNAAITSFLLQLQNSTCHSAHTLTAHYTHHLRDCSM